MADYRIYTLGNIKRRIIEARLIEASTDAEALAAAEELRGDHDLEVWTGTRRVGVVRTPRSATTQPRRSETG